MYKSLILLMLNPELRFILFILVFMLCSCKEDLQQKEMDLSFGLGTILFTDYLDFEWQCEWQRASDMAYLHERKYRFAKKAYEPLSETGYISKNYPDSVYQMTLTSFTEDAKMVYDKEKPHWGFKELYPFHVRFRRLRDLNVHVIDTSYTSWLNHDGYKISYETYMSRDIVKRSREYLIDIQYSAIQLLFECSGNMCDDFFDDVTKTVQSFKLD